jgi:hypothetical protein
MTEEEEEEGNGIFSHLLLQFFNRQREYLFFTTNAMLFLTAEERDGIKVI